MTQEKGLVYLALAVALWTFTFFGTPAPAQAQDWRDFSADLDGDGLPNDVEQNGWYNTTGGPYITDYLDADSDDDGLADGQEKLYDTDPNNDTNPGIYAEYEDQLKTIEYSARNPNSPEQWGWQQYGSKFISFDAVVVRRGTAFSVGGPANATIQVIKSLGLLTTLTPVRDPCAGRWTITIPSDTTVGKYTVELERGVWSKSLDLFVIFELPEPSPSFTQAMIDAFLYDDNPDNIRDEIGINLGVVEYNHDDYEWIPAGDYYIAAGFGYGFELQQFESFVFEEHVIEAINGYDNQWDAARALVARADQVTRFDHPRWLPDSWSVLNPGSDDRNQCSNIAGLLTAFYRSAGIPARPFFVDMRHSTFDHAAEVWINDTWWASRGYVSYEPEGCGWDCEFGHRDPQSRYWWGYAPYYRGDGTVEGGSGNMMFAVGENWVETEVSSIGTSPENHEYRWANWDVNSIVRKDWFDTVVVPYWERWMWTEEPAIVGTHPVTGRIRQVASWQR